MSGVRTVLLYLKDADGNEWTLVANVLENVAPKGKMPTLDSVKPFMDLPKPLVVTEMKVITR